MQSDERLTVEAARKDPGQFAALYEANFERVYAYVARRVKGRAEVEDLTSEVFRRALSSLHAYESRGAPFSAWLLRIAANAVVDRARRASRRSPSAAELSLSIEPSEPERLDAESRARLFRCVDPERLRRDPVEARDPRLERRARDGDPAQRARGAARGREALDRRGRLSRAHRPVTREPQRANGASSCAPRSGGPRKSTRR